MKRTIFLITLSLITAGVFGQKAEPVYGFARVHKSSEWYQEQEKAWGKELGKDSSNALAWWYYYRVTRNLAYSNHDSTIRSKYNSKLDKIQKDVERHISGTFEYNLIKWYYNGNDFDSVKYLKKAVEIDENRIEIMDYMVNWAEVDRDISRRDKWSKKWMATGEFSPGLMYYNYNVIAGLKPNAIILTAGDNDTYPIWLLQAQGIRRDITVINIGLITIDEYRKKVFGELGIDYASFWSNDPGKKNLKHWKENCVQILASNRKKYPVYTALTVPENCRKNVEANLYLTGLVMEYSTKPVDNMAQMKRNFEKEYALDYLDKAFFTDISEERVQSVNANYIIPMVKLYDHYKEAGDTARMEWIRRKLLSVVKGRDEEGDIKKHLSE